MKPERDEDEGLLRRAVLSGDDAAWRVLYDRHFDEVYAYVRRRCLNGTRAEDVVQEVWMTAVRRIRRFDPAKGSFGAWLTGIADKCLRNDARRWRRRDATELPVDGLETASGNGHAEVKDMVGVVMAALPERYRSVLAAKYSEQASVAEIASRWNESEKAIESLLTRARQAFRSEYDKHEA